MSHIVLAIDTSAGSAVALVNGETVRRAVSQNPRAHAEHLASLIAEVLDAGPAPTAVAVGTGPAPFTGLRAGLVTAETFAFARNLPLWGVPSLDAIASTALAERGELVTVVSDARRKEVYAATYQSNGDDVTRAGEFYVGPPEELKIPAGSHLVGSGTQLFPDVLAGEAADVDPAALARLALARAARGMEQPTRPLYLRRPDAKVPFGR